MENQNGTSQTSSPQQLNTQPQHPGHKSRSFLTRKLFLIFVLSLTLFAIVCAGIYLSLNSSWKKYTNIKMGYAVRYPSNYVLKGYCLDFESIEESNVVTFYPPIVEGYGEFTIIVHNIKNEEGGMTPIGNMTPHEYLNKFFQESEESIIPNSRKSIKVDGVEALTFSENSGGTEAIYTILVRDHRLFEIHFATPDPEKNKNLPISRYKNLAVNDQILSTLRITKANPNYQPTKNKTGISKEISNWKIFENRSVSFKYPSDWRNYGAQIQSCGGKYDISVNSSINYNPKTGLPYNKIGDDEMLVDFIKGRGDKISIDGLDALKATYDDRNEIYVFSRDKRYQYNISIRTDFVPYTDPIYKQIFGTLKISSNPTSYDGKIYKRENPQITFTYPSRFKVLKEDSSSASFTFNDDNINYAFPYLIVSFNKNTVDFNAYKLCSSIKEQWPNFTPCVSEVSESILGGVKAKRFGLALGIDNGYTVVQTISQPIIEIKMFAAGGGLWEILNLVLSTFKFTDQ